MKRSRRDTARFSKKFARNEYQNPIDAPLPASFSRFAFSSSRVSSSSCDERSLRALGLAIVLVPAVRTFSCRACTYHSGGSLPVLVAIVNGVLVGTSTVDVATVVDVAVLVATNAGGVLVGRSCAWLADGTSNTTAAAKASSACVFVCFMVVCFGTALNRNLSLRLILLRKQNTATV